jgi:hypothetical protein
MLLLIEVTINVLAIPAIAIGSFIGGYMFNTARHRGLKKNLERLENDMLHNHAEILRLQKELAEKESSASQTPIVPIRENSGLETAKGNPGDQGLLKKIIKGNH